MIDQVGRGLWTSYVKHDDAEAVAERVSAAGGAVIMPPMDVMEEGRMAMFADPTGAVWGVWQPNNHTGAQVVNSPNSLVWTELQTNDTDRARAFYSDVFGWDSAVDDTDYIAFSQDERVHAGAMAIQPEWGEMPPNWSVYFLVDDLDAMVAKVERVGRPGSQRSDACRAVGPAGRGIGSAGRGVQPHSLQRPGRCAAERLDSRNVSNCTWMDGRPNVSYRQVNDRAGPGVFPLCGPALNIPGGTICVN